MAGGREPLRREVNFKRVTIFPRFSMLLRRMTSVFNLSWRQAPHGFYSPLSGLLRTHELHTSRLQQLHLCQCFDAQRPGHSVFVPSSDGEKKHSVLELNNPNPYALLDSATSPPASPSPSSSPTKADPIPPAPSPPKLRELPYPQSRPSSPTQDTEVRSQEEDTQKQQLEVPFMFSRLIKT